VLFHRNSFLDRECGPLDAISAFDHVVEVVPRVSWQVVDDDCTDAFKKGFGEFLSVSVDGGSSQWFGVVLARSQPVRELG